MNKRSKIFIIVLLVIVLAVWLCIIMSARQKSEETVSKGGKESPAADTRAIEANSLTICDWLELPAAYDDAEGDYVVTHRAEMGGRLQRNYTVSYDADRYAALWVAYPLCHDHMSSGRKEAWGFDPLIPKTAQTSVRSGYGASIPTINYPENFYARGHQLPNADRSGVPEMMAQTYYSTNMTPQIQNGFNGAIWAKLEEAVRSAVPHDDTLYVVTGAAFSRAGLDEKVKTVVNKNDSKELPVPNYYWKVLLKVKRNAGSVAQAQTIGFWLPHDDLKGHSYVDYVVSVDQIEQWTGLDLFVNLPDVIEVSAEKNISWSGLREF